MATNVEDLTEEEMDRQVKEAMKNLADNEALANLAEMEVSTEIEPNQDQPIDEAANQQRPEKNEPGIIGRLFGGLLKTVGSILDELFY